MGYDFKPKNKSAGWFNLGAFSFSWMLEAGAGLPLGFGKGLTPGMVVYKSRPDGMCIHTNDGAGVTAKEAKEMAKVLRWICDYQDLLNEIWTKQPEEDQRRMTGDHTHLYNIPIRRDFVDKARAFADWAEKSGGFAIH